MTTMRSACFAVMLAAACAGDIPLFGQTPSPGTTVKDMVWRTDTAERDPGKRISLAHTPCVPLDEWLSCRVVITNHETRAGSVSFDDNSYLVMPDRSVARIAGYILGGRRVMTNGGASVDLEPAIPTAVQLLFPKPSSAGTVQVVLAAGHEGSILVLGAPVKPAAGALGSVTSGGLRFDLESCTRAETRVDCSALVTNTRAVPVRLSVPIAMIARLSAGWFSAAGGEKLPMSELKLGADRGIRRDDIRLVPFLPIRITFSGRSIDSAIDSVRFGLEFHAGGTAISVPFKAVTGLAATASKPGVSVNVDNWVVHLPECTQDRGFLGCRARVTNAGVESEAFSAHEEGSYLATPDGERLPLKVRRLSHQRHKSAAVNPGTTGANYIGRDDAADLLLVFAGVPAAMAGATLVVKTGDGLAVLRNVPVKQGDILTVVEGFTEATRVQAVSVRAADAESRRLHSVLADPKTPALDKEAAAELLWARYGDRTGRTFLVGSYRRFLQEQAAAAGPNSRIDVACAGFDSLKRAAPCGRLLKVIPNIRSLADQGVFEEGVRVLAGRVRGDLANRLQDALAGAPVEWRRRAKPSVDHANADTMAIEVVLGLGRR